ncbi:MAG: bifunctional nuclease family protein [Armatimonadetes bacterium]|nr:bifunctional nuclease family protein [Armatimonadota bacterium]
MGHDLRDLFGEWDGDPADLHGEPAIPEEADETRRRKVVLREAHVVGVFEQRRTGAGPGKAFVLLEDKHGRRVPIWIGEFEAYAIASGDTKPSDRPATHDLLRRVIEHLGARVVRIYVDDIWQETFYAKVTVLQDGVESDIDCRPSDAIALAVRAGAPIYIAENVLEAASKQT